MSTVSVVVPTYNRPDYLRGAITTALGQTHDEIEVVVVDDGSTDPYAHEIVAEFPDSVVCISHDENRGLSAARNTGIHHTNGEFIAFLDDDDRWHESKIARQVSALNDYRDAGLVTCLVVAITPENEIVHCETNAPRGDCSNSMLIGNQIGTPSRVLVRRECIDDIGTFDESLPTKQDWDYFLRLCQEWEVAAVEEHLCFRTVHESMSSSSSALERDKEAILNKHEDTIRAAGVWDQAQALAAEEIGRSYLGDHQLKKARTHLRRSLSHVTVRRVALLSLCYSRPVIVDTSIRVVRDIKRWVSSCTGRKLTPTEIPGLSS